MDFWPLRDCCPNINKQGTPYSESRSTYVAVGGEGATLGEAESPVEDGLASRESVACSFAEGLSLAGLQGAVICCVGLRPSSQPK